MGDNATILGFLTAIITLIIGNYLKRSNIKLRLPILGELRIAHTESFERVIETMQARISSLEESNNTLNHRVLELEEKEKQYQAELVMAKQTIISSATNVAKLQKIIDDLEQQLASNKADIKTLNEENINLREKLERNNIVKESADSIVAYTQTELVRVFDGIMKQIEQRFSAFMSAAEQREISNKETNAVATQTVSHKTEKDGAE